MKSIFELLVAFIAVVLFCTSADAQSKSDSTEEEQVPKIKRATDEPEETEAQARSWRELARTSDAVLNAFKNVVQASKDATVRVLSSEDELLAMGTIVDADGLILTKASEMHGDLKCEIGDGRTLPAKVFGVHRESDLAVLKVDATNLPVIQWQKEEIALPVGTWLATPGNQEKPLSVGVVSVIARRVVPGGVLGVYLEDHEQGVRIDRVITDSPAESVDIRVNDVIVAVNGKETKTREALIRAVKQYGPGDRIEITALRSGAEMTFRPVLGRRTVLEEKGERARSNIQNRMGSELSVRRTGFSSVIQHDTMLAPNQCGGVVVDIHGKAVGLNIARSGRIMSFALPATTVLPVLARLVSGEFSPEVVNRERLELIQKELDELAEKEKNLPTEQERMAEEVEKLNQLIDSLKQQVSEAEAEMEKAAAELEENEKQRNELARELRSAKRTLRKIDSIRQQLAEERAALMQGTFPKPDDE